MTMEIRLSSRFAKSQQWIWLYLVPLLIAFLGLAWGYYVGVGSGLISSLAIVYIGYTMHKRAKKLFPLAYTRDALLAEANGQFTEIPLTAIREVNIKTASGEYEIVFYPGEAPFQCLSFMPSLAYPLNYKTMDARVNAFRIAIAKAQQGNRQAEKAALTSNVS